jgi:hypothetical protein
MASVLSALDIANLNIYKFACVIQLISELNARRERGLKLPVLPGSTRDQAVQCLQASHPAREAQFESRHLGMAQFEPPATISEKSMLSFYW